MNSLSDLNVAKHSKIASIYELVLGLLVPSSKSCKHLVKHWVRSNCSHNSEVRFVAEQWLAAFVSHSRSQNSASDNQGSKGSHNRTIASFSIPLLELFTIGYKFRSIFNLLCSLWSHSSFELGLSLQQSINHLERSWLLCPKPVTLVTASGLIESIFNHFINLI